MFVGFFKLRRKQLLIWKAQNIINVRITMILVNFVKSITYQNAKLHCLSICTVFNVRGGKIDNTITLMKQ